MTSCTSNDELLWDYLYDLLDPAQTNQLEEHLATCAACRQALDLAKVDCANLAAAARLDGPFPLFKLPEAVAAPTIPFRSAWSPAGASRWYWVAAAAVLLVVGLPFAGYQLGSIQRTQTVQQTEAELLAARLQRENFRDQIEQAQTVAALELQTKHLRLQVHGPADFQPNQANVFRVSTTNLAGKPVAAHVTARVAQDKSDTPLFEKQLDSQGDLLVALPPLDLKQGSKATVEFFADGAQGPERVGEILEVQPSPQTTHLVLEKNVYLPGDRVLFRSVTLERSTWRPDATPFAIKYELKGPDGAVVTSVSGTTREGGIGGGDFNLPAAAKPGIYKLTAADADGRFAPVTRTLRVADGPAPPARLDHIQFFPEGGSLIAGIPTRVYFSARGTNDEPVELEGAILDGKRQEVGTIRSVALQGKPHLGAGRGFFVLTPKKGERYSVRPKDAAPQDPVHALPRVLESGLGLALTNPVVHRNEEIHATVYAVGEQTPVVIGIFARGRMIAHQTANLHAGANAIALPAQADLAGVYRVALFPAQSGTQLPMAERLGYCRAEPGLPVTWETAARDGKRVLKIHSGAGTPEKSWFAVSIQPADDAALLDRVAGNGLWSGLVLGQDLPRSWPEDNLGALLRDEPAMVEALALYLGLQGPDPKQSSPREQRPAPVLAKALRAGVPSIAMLNLDNAESVKAKFASALTSRFAVLEQQERFLAQQEATAQAQSDASRLELEAYRDRAIQLFSPLLNVLVVAFFAIACIGLTMAIWRMMCNQPGARSWVLTSCGTLVACLVFVGLSPLRFDTPQGFQRLPEMPEIALRPPEAANQIAKDTGIQFQHPQVMNISAAPRPAVDRSKPLPVSPVQSKSLWLPAIPSNDGACEVELTVPPGKLGHILQVDVFTASGRVGSTTALVK